MYNLRVSLKPQDVIVLLKLLLYGDSRPSYAQIAKDLFLSPSEVHAAVQRARQARLLQGPEPGELNRSALLKFLIHGVKYAFPPERGELTRGIPTAHAAEPLKSQIAMANDLPPVWPSANGKVRGYSFAPCTKPSRKRHYVTRVSTRCSPWSMPSETDAPVNGISPKKH